MYMLSINKLWRLVTIAALLAGALNLSLVPATPAQALSTTLVISQFQVAGGTAADEFVEIHNISGSSVDINGYTLVYRSATGTTDVSLASWTASTVIPAGGYYLVAATPGYDGTTVADKTFADGGSGKFSGTSGGLALRNGAVNTGTIVDSLGYGSATNAFVEGSTTTAPASNTSKERISSGCQDTDSNSADFTLVNPSAPRNSATAVNLCSTGTSLSINDVSQDEGNSGVTNFLFTVSLSAPAPVGGVTFDIATADGTATAGSDYVAKSLSGQTITAGNTSYTFDVTVNGDYANEPSETFFVNLTNVTGVTVADGQGQGTITNDDTAITPIYSIQGTTDTTPLPGVQTTLGVVVGDYEGASPALGGFYIQDPTGDGNPATSDGLYIYNGSSNSVSLGDLVRVTGKNQYWNNLIRFMVQDEKEDRNLLMLYRVMYNTNSMSAGNYYVEMSQLLLDAALPGEAQAVLEKAFANNMIKDDQKERTTRLLNAAKTRADADRKGLPQFEAEASKNKVGEADVKLGEVYYGFGDYQNAVKSIQRGLDKGQVKHLDEAYVYMGLAQQQLKNDAEAKKAFGQLKSVPNINPRVLKLWTLYAEKQI